jgi:hypothetical protein
MTQMKKTIGHPILIDIAKGLSESLLIDRISILNKADIESKGLYGLTPLAVACIKGNQVAIEALLKKGANLFAIDNVGWTPYQYLQMMNHPLKDELNKSLSPHQRASTALFDAVHSPAMERSDDSVLRDEQGVFFRFNSETFFDKTNSNYRAVPLASKDVLYELWLDRISFQTKKDPLTLSLPFSFETPIQKPPAVYLQKNSLGMLQSFAGKTLKKGAMIRVLSGEIDPHLPELGAYSSTQPWWVQGTLNSVHYRNEGNFARHGFPNCQIVPIEQNGIPLYTLVATEEISPGTPLRIYTALNHPHRQLPPPIEEQEAVLQTFTSLKAMKRRIQQLQDQSYDPFAVIERRDLEQKLSYLAESPHTLALLAFRTKIDLEPLQTPLPFLKDLQKIKKHLKGCHADLLLSWLYWLPTQMVPDAIAKVAENLENGPSDLISILPDIQAGFVTSETMVQYIAGECTDGEALAAINSWVSDSDSGCKGALACLALFERAGKAADAKSIEQINRLRAAFLLHQLGRGKPFEGKALASMIPLSDQAIGELQTQMSDSNLNRFFQKAHNIHEQLMNWAISPDLIEELPFDSIMEGLSIADRNDLANGIDEFIDILRPDQKQKFAVDFATFSFEAWDGAKESLDSQSLAPFRPLSQENRDAIQVEFKEKFRGPHLIKLLTLLRKLREETPPAEEKKE